MLALNITDLAEEAQLRGGSVSPSTATALGIKPVRPASPPVGPPVGASPTATARNRSRSASGTPPLFTAALEHADWLGGARVLPDAQHAASAEPPRHRRIAAARRCARAGARAGGNNPGGGQPPCVSRQRAGNLGLERRRRACAFRYGRRRRR